MPRLTPSNTDNKPFYNEPGFIGGVAGASAALILAAAIYWRKSQSLPEVSATTPPESSNLVYLNDQNRQERLSGAAFGDSSLIPVGSSPRKPEAVATMDDLKYGGVSKV